MASSRTALARRTRALCACPEDRSWTSVIFIDGETRDVTSAFTGVGVIRFVGDRSLLGVLFGSQVSVDQFARLSLAASQRKFGCLTRVAEVDSVCFPSPSPQCLSFGTAVFLMRSCFPSSEALRSCFRPHFSAFRYGDHSAASADSSLGRVWPPFHGEARFNCILSWRLCQLALFCPVLVVDA
jgi:hypothetical protein